MFVLHLPPLVQLCAPSFSQNTGTQQTSSWSVLLRPAPESSRSPGAPVSIFARDVLFSDTLLSWAEEVNPATDLWCCFDVLKAGIELWKPGVAEGTVGFN